MAILLLLLHEFNKYFSTMLGILAFLYHGNTELNSQCLLFYYIYIMVTLISLLYTFGKNFSVMLVIQCFRIVFVSCMVTLISLLYTFGKNFSVMLAIQCFCIVAKL